MPEGQSKAPCDTPSACRQKATDVLRGKARRIRSRAQELLRRADNLETLADGCNHLNTMAEEALWEVAINLEV